MRTHKTSVRTLLCLTTALCVLCFLLLPSFGGETAHAISSLTPDQRNHLPDNTQVTLPGRGTVTLGALRAEHRARMERFSKATAWGKAAAGRLTKPAASSGPSSKNSVPGPTPPPPLGGGLNSQGSLQHFSAQAPGVGAGGSKADTTLAGQQQKANAGTGGGIQSPGAVSNNSATLAGQPQKQSGGLGGGLQGNGALGSPNSGSSPAAKNAAGPPNAGKGSDKTVMNAASSSLFLVPRQAYPGVPIPRDYLAFCNAAQASACIYLPPNANFVNFKYLPNLAQAIPDITGNPDRVMADVDVLMTDQPLCRNLGGMWSSDAQACAFIYFIVQQTTFKPAGKPASAVSCNGQTDYRLDPKRGTILAEWPPPPYYDSFQTDATPITCVVQVWMYP
jgi:hypothetical protein